MCMGCGFALRPRWSYCTACGMPNGRGRELPAKRISTFRSVLIGAKVITMVACAQEVAARKRRE